GRQGGYQRGVGVQRGGRGGHAGRAVAEGNAALEVGPAHQVGVDDARGLTGGRRGVDDVEEDRRGQCDGGRLGVGPGLSGSGGWAGPSSRLSSGMSLRAVPGSRARATAVSTKNSRAAESRSMVSRLSLVEEGARGATTTPARSAARNMTT